MAAKIIILGLSIVSFALAGDLVKKPVPFSEIVIHATGNSSVPSVDYVVDAVELLKEAYEVYPDDLNRAQLYMQLFQGKHPDSEWNLAIGYTYISIKSKYYIETEVSSGGKSEKSSKDKKKDTLVMLFSTETEL